ncbi:AAA family ATPase [Streptoalloteichus hindustanus]|uniref:AAA family ATPase n=1 Tax=Streptoalloteichus hindustanus TaxID=2017 RepID=UPI001356496D|nr:helix-turn-helix transcriptional regulator [Streptoalloteichus hindustanus]
MALVEREPEERALRQAFAACLAGHGRTVLVTGPLGVGKTALLHAFADQIGLDALVLSAAGARTEQDRAGGVVAELLRGARRHITSEVVEADPPPARSACAALLELAAHRPVVVLVDDTHFADTTSREAVLALHRRLRNSPVLLVCAEWDHPRLRPAPFRAELSRDPDFLHLRLDPLSPDGVAALLAARWGNAARAEELARECHRLSGGNPLLALAAAEDALDPRRRGRAVARAVLTCLHRGGSPLLRVACGLAVLGEWVTRGGLARLAGTDPDAVGHAVEVLREAGLVRGLRFRCPTAATAVLEHLEPADRARLHRRAAELLHRAGAPAREVARSLAAAGHAAPGWPVAMLREAAARAVGDDEVPTAVRWWELALTGCRDERERAAITTALARAQWRVNPTAALRRVTADNPDNAGSTSTSSAGSAPGEDAAVVAARCLLWEGHLDHAAALLDRARRPAPCDLRLLAQWLYGRHRARGALGGPGRWGVRAAEHVVHSHRLDDATFPALVRALAVLIDADRRDLALPRCVALLAEARHRRATTWQAVFGSLHADLALRCGDLRAALDAARRALSALGAAGWGAAVGFPLSTLVLAATAAGRHEEAATALLTTVPDTATGTVPGLLHLRACGHHHLATGHVRAAMAEFHTCGRLAGAAQVDEPAVELWRVDLAQCYLALGQPDRARAWALRQLGRAGPDRPRARGTALRVLAATEPPARRPRLLGDAMTLLWRAGDRLELTRVLADLSRAHHELGEPSRARLLSRRAAAGARACHAEDLRRELERDRPVECGRDRAGRVLTAAEQRVAALAALGHTNHEIGQRLQITDSTVEQHLTRVYRKLNVSRRTELPSALPSVLSPRPAAPAGPHGIRAATASVPRTAGWPERTGDC